MASPPVHCVMRSVRSNANVAALSRKMPQMSRRPSVQERLRCGHRGDPARFPDILDDCNRNAQPLDRYDDLAFAIALTMHMRGCDEEIGFGPVLPPHQIGLGVVDKGVALAAHGDLVELVIAGDACAFGALEIGLE